MYYPSVTFHMCNEPIRCPWCIKRFWKWLEAYTQGRAPTRREHTENPPNYFECAGKFLGQDNRRVTL